MSKVDILVIASHPDDAELCCSGTIAAHIALGYKVAMVDLTQGELGTRGTPQLRMEEANASAELLGVENRVNLGLPDGYLQDNEYFQLKIIEQIRKFQPSIVLANAVKDRHPDHGNGSELISHACFSSGLRKIETSYEGEKQNAHRPSFVYHFIQDRYIDPDIIFDITPYWDKKVASIKAFRSQFYNPDSDEPDTYISSGDFFQFIEARAREMGHAIGVTYGEGFTAERKLGAGNLFDLI